MKANINNICLIEKAEELKKKIIEYENSLDFASAARCNKQFNDVMEEINHIALINPDVYSKFTHKIILK